MGRVRSPRTLVGLAVLAAVVILVVVAVPFVAPLVAPGPTTSTPTSPGLPYVPPDGGSAAPSPAATGAIAPATNGASPTPFDGEPGIVATRVVVPRLSIDLPVVEGDGVDAPMGMAAHYPGTSWPGGGSNIYLYAHARKQMFQNLWDTQLGDLVFVDLVDGGERVYQVTQIEPDIPWNDMSVVDPTPSEQLTLQTCTGTQDTDPRFLVIATPVS